MRSLACKALWGSSVLGQGTDVRFPDTATIAAAAWLKKAKISPDKIRADHGEWNGQQLHWPKHDFDKDEKSVPRELWDRLKQERGKEEVGFPPAYYAVIAMDGDKMGRWLAGEKNTRVKVVLHRKICEYYESLPGTEKGLEARRPTGPAMHAAISEALANFALHIVPKKLPGRDEDLYLVVVDGFGEKTLLLLPNLSVKKTYNSLWRVVGGCLTRWRIEETIRFWKQSYSVEDIRVLTYRRLRNMIALVLAACFFAAVRLGEDVKLIILACRLKQLSKRLFGIPDFHYYALADGVAHVLCRAGHGPRCGPPPRDPTDLQLPLFDDP